MKIFIILFFMLVPMVSYSQFVLANEEIIYSFETGNSKKMVLVKDKNNEYIQYRFGTKNKVEMEFPTKRSEESWKMFHYIFYMRGGGKANSAQEIANLGFTNSGFHYVIYSTYFSEKEEIATEILVTDMKNNKTTRIKGIVSSRIGSLFSLDSEMPLEFDEDAGFDF